MQGKPHRKSITSWTVMAIGHRGFFLLSLCIVGNLSQSLPLPAARAKGSRYLGSDGIPKTGRCTGAGTDPVNPGERTSSPCLAQGQRHPGKHPHFPKHLKCPRAHLSPPCSPQHQPWAMPSWVAPQQHPLSICLLSADRFSTCLNAYVLIPLF